MVDDPDLVKKVRFGIIPTLTSEVKEKFKAEYAKRLKELQNKGDDAERFLKDKKGVVDTSPTSMKMKNTFILQNNNPSFDQYH